MSTIDTHEESIMSTIDTHEEQCAVLCKPSTCNGTVAACLKGDSRHYCYSCHAYSCGNNIIKIA